MILKFILSEAGGRRLDHAYANASTAGVDQQQLLSYQDLKSKLEHFQSRIKQAVTVVKPHLNMESAVSALVALQELEGLATMDVSAPLVVQGQEPLFQN
ncbi:unnamed protein product [Ilex paraguariensis]|uniref:Uncharacterized protein n=1 Tax=Ilex paraguariensis TaxID=185542 RepID=A0ABC8R528_9AQUA